MKLESIATEFIRNNIKVQTIRHVKSCKQFIDSCSSLTSPHSKHKLHFTIFTDLNVAKLLQVN